MGINKFVRKIFKVIGKVDWPINKYLHIFRQELISTNLIIFDNKKLLD